MNTKPGMSTSNIEVNEFRGVWIATVHNINFPSKPGVSADQMKAELDDIIKTCKEAHLNAIFFQVRPASDALYDSGIFPVSEYLTGTQGAELPEGFDPLRYIIQIAHQNNIELHAWVNPYRITNGSVGSFEEDLNALAATNPARQNPSWVVKYANGKMQYDPGLPETQSLITNGVLEIVKNYDVDGIHFDDYFYPYPVDGASFDDAATYQKHGSAYTTIEEFRRASVNNLVQSVYTEIKKTNPAVRFGISPFPVWANKSAAHPEGSETSGFEGLQLFCDAKAWAEGGYVDYLCPQLYCAFENKVYPYDVLVRWWSDLLDGTNVDLYIGHAVFKLPADFKSETEIPRQVEFARNHTSVKGSVFYGYAALKDNSYKVKDSLNKLFAEHRPVSKL